MSSNRILSSFLWRFLERGSSQMVTFIVSLVLARLLDPAAFGTISLILVFVTILQVFVDSGLGNALIQKKNADDLDFSSVFLFSLLACVILYFILFFCAPFISTFYKSPELTPYIRVLGLTLIVSGVRNVQQAYISKHFQFKKLYIASISGASVSAVVAIFMAYFGFGIWAIVAQHLVNLGASTLILWFLIEWKPKANFSFDRLKSLFAFGWKLLVSSLLQVTNDKLRQLFIGKIYSKADLAFYNNGEYYPYVLTSSINTAVDSVLLPAISAEQDDRERVKYLTRRAITISCFIMAPLMVCFSVMAKELVLLILTEKWLPCVPFIIVFCFANMLRPITTANLNAIKALGRSDLILKLELFKIIASLSILFATIHLGVMAIAIGHLITYVICQAINAHPNSKLLGYSYMEQLKDVAPYISLSLSVGAVVWPISLLGLNIILTLVLQGIAMALLYFGSAKLLRLRVASDVLEYILNLFKHESK